MLGKQLSLLSSHGNRKNHLVLTSLYPCSDYIPQKSDVTNTCGSCVCAGSNIPKDHVPLTVWSNMLTLIAGSIIYACTRASRAGVLPVD